MLRRKVVHLGIGEGSVRRREETSTGGRETRAECMDCAHKGDT